MSLHSLHTPGLRLIFFLCTLFSVKAKSQVVANFTLEARQGCAPFVVYKFTNLSSGNPVRYFWDFGNGNTSTQQNAGTIYFSPGSYTVKLVVEDAAGIKDSAIKTNFIVVNQIPTINFTANSTSGCNPLTVNFTDQSTAASGSMSSWQWDFGDGETSSIQSPSHTFTSAGDFTITLKAADEVGCSDVHTISSFIHVAQPPKARFTSSSAVCNPALVDFVNTSAGGPFSNITWKFGDGTSSTLPNPSHKYVASGTYPVTLIVKAENGCIDSVTNPTVAVLLVTDFTGPGAVCQGALANFVNTSSPTIASSFWDFGDNTSSSTINPAKRFTNAGTFEVKLVNDFGSCKDSVTKTITVFSKPAVDFSFATPPTSCTLPVNVSFTAKTSAASYLWNFGDNTTSTTANPTHTYTAFGTYGTKLVVTGSNGCSDSITKSNVVSIIPAKINGFNGLPFKGCVPSQQAFSVNITSPDPVTSYTWNFGDGNTSNSSAPTYDYTKEGSYDVSLEITTAKGCVDKFVLPAAVSITTKPKAGFTATPVKACASDTIQFTDMSTGTINSRKWDFGDLTTSTLTNSFHRYRDSGYFTVKLIVGNAACFDTATKSNYIFINPPIAKFTVQFNCSARLSRHFQNKSALAPGSAPKYNWDFGDKGVSTDVSPDHTYAKPGTYIVHLLVSVGGCNDDIIDTIKVVEEHPNFTVNQTELCRNSTSVFTATNINPQNIAAYNWDFGDNTSVVTATTPVVNHNYVSAGVFSPVLTVTDVSGCTLVADRSVNVTIVGPHADFTNPNAACSGKTVTFTDNSRPSAAHQITSWILNYGDGKADTSATAAFSHVYTVPQTYNASLIVTDDKGCSDTLSKSAAITVTTAKASFSLGDSIFCNNSVINFVNNSIGYKLTYLWDFGDGSAESVAAPSHTFSSAGTYNVTLIIKDSVGCIDTATTPKAIIIGNAVASFSVDASVISCPPAQINFTNKSMYSTSVKWNFDDGNFSTVANPIHYFSTAGTYHVKLITYGHGTCADSTVKDIIVKGPKGSFTYRPVFRCAPATVNFAEDATDFNKNFTWDFGDGTTATTAGSSISHIYNAPGKYLPKLFLIDTSINCQVSIFGTDTITVSTASGYIKSHGSLFCDSAGIQFYDSSLVQFDTITSYLWTFGDGITSNDANPYHSYAAAGVYAVELKIKTAGGCTETSVNNSIKIVRSPKVDVTGPAEICANQPATFFGTVQREDLPVSWTWDFDNGNKYSVPFPPTQTFSRAGNYAVHASVQNSSGCINSDTIILTVYPLPDLNLSPDSVICRGTKVILHASGADTYLWGSAPSLNCTSCANPVASPVDFSVYYVTGTNALTGCRQTDSVRITVVQPFTVMAVNGDTICVGQQVKLLASGTDQYAWTPAAGLTNTNTANPVAHPDTTTLYTVIGHDNYNCFRDTAYVPIVVYPNPVFNIVDDNITVAAGTAVTLKTSSSGDISAWQWFPATGLSCSNCPEPVATANNTISYKAIASNPGGCRAEDRVTIQVFCNNGNVFIPNTFSPNNDGSNDVFYPRGKGIAGIKNLRIFNRWGVVVFEKSNFAANDPTAGWDGTYKGKPVDADVFIYQAEVICQTGEAFAFKGDITVIR